MKKVLSKIGGLLIIYALIIIGVLLLNSRFRYINEIQSKNIDNNYIAMN